MNWNDHPPAYFHARYSEPEAAIRLDTLEVEAGHLPRRILGLVLEWAADHRAELWAVRVGLTRFDGHLGADDIIPKHMSKSPKATAATKLAAAPAVVAVAPPRRRRRGPLPVWWRRLLWGFCSCALG